MLYLGDIVYHIDNTTHYTHQPENIVILTSNRQIENFPKFPDVIPGE